MKANKLDQLGAALEAEFGAPEPDVQADLQGEVAALTAEVAAKALVIEELQSRWDAAGQSIDHLTAMIANQAKVIGQQREELDRMMAEYRLQAQAESLQEGEEATEEGYNPEPTPEQVAAMLALADAGPVCLQRQADHLQGEGELKGDGTSPVVQNAPNAVTAHDAALQPAQHAQNGPDAPDCLRLQAASLQGKETQRKGDGTNSGVQDAQNVQNAPLPGLPGLLLSPASQNALDGAENCRTCSQAPDELVTRNHELQAENARLLRRIEELGGKPPKRDRAAYMRQYRTRTARQLCGADPESKIKFV